MCTPFWTCISTLTHNIVNIHAPFAISDIFKLIRGKCLHLPKARRKKHPSGQKQQRNQRLTNMLMRFSITPSSQHVWRQWTVFTNLEKTITPIQNSTPPHKMKRRRTLNIAISEEKHRFKIDLPQRATHEVVFLLVFLHLEYHPLLLILATSSFLLLLHCYGGCDF